MRRLVQYVATNRHPLRDRVIVLLSFKAGLRACGIAGLDWTMVLRANGRIGEQLLIAAIIAKNGQRDSFPSSQNSPLPFGDCTFIGKPTAGPVIRSERGTHMQPAASSTGLPQPVPRWGCTVAAHIHAGARSSRAPRD